MTVIRSELRALARLGRIGGIADHIVKRFDLDLHDILQTVEASTGGKIVDVVDEADGDRVEICRVSAAGAKRAEGAMCRARDRARLVTAVSPLEASSAGAVRHRLNRGGNRRLNMLFHVISLTQGRSYPPARTYLARRRAEGLTAREARRALKRHLVRRVFHAWRSCFTQDLEVVAA